MTRNRVDTNRNSWRDKRKTGDILALEVFLNDLERLKSDPNFGAGREQPRAFSEYARLIFKELLKN